MAPIISARGLGKSYQIQTGEKKRYHTLRDDLIEGARNFVQGKWRRSRTEEFWALKDIDLDIYPGEVVGIIGRNGAGKSTLLKILSRVVQPTTGEAVLYGRVASLLEVGTGFHPELSGRENIFMSGAVLGMQQAEIRRKFDEIVAFAEVEKFLDTPVKRYSSGMYVRLAFAVAAHLEPDILLVDEVLAVGDAAFQKKCLGKMEDVAKNQGRTVLFVSHNIATITSLCPKAIWLHSGQLHLSGKANSVISKYLTFGAESSGEVVFSDNLASPKFCFQNLSLLNSAQEVTSTFDVRDSITIQIKYQAAQTIVGLEISLRVYNSGGIPIFTTNRSSSLGSDVTKGYHQSAVEIPTLFLVPDSYSIDLTAHIPHVEVLSYHQSLLNFEIEETGSGMSLYKGAAFGVVMVNFPWKEIDLERGEL